MDADPTVLPGAFECTDGKDNNCRGGIDEGPAPGCECYVDMDKDGFAVSTTGSIASAGNCPSGYTRTRPTDATNTDCGPLAPSAFPGQTAYFSTSYCKDPKICTQASPRSFDYNCSGAETSLYIENKLAAASCVGATEAFACLYRSGWIAGPVPACGAKATYRSCAWSDKSKTCSGTDIANHPRSCR